jgi:2-polyprenyl-6-methoxyphenol hydroxylase-like FAD-dependent oxidoreductase
MRVRRDDRRRIRYLTDSLVKGFGSAVAPVQWARSSGLLLLSGAPALQRRFARIAMGLSTPQPRLVRGVKT